MPTKKTSKPSTKKSKGTAQEFQPKTIRDNPEVWHSSALVSNVVENPDGSATITLDLEADQRDMLWDVFLRSAIIEGLKTVESKFHLYSEQLKTIDMTSELVDKLIEFETSDDIDFADEISDDVKKLKKQLNKINK